MILGALVMFNPVWLNTFVTLVNTGHFTKTAEKLFMTQPGVSQHINKLENAFGYSLIRRDKKSFEITEQGRLVFQYAIKLTKNENELLEKLSFDNPFAGECSLGCSGALALMLYPKLLDKQVQYSSLVVSLKAAPNQQILNEVQNGLLDLGMVTHVPNTNLFDAQEIGTEELYLVFPATMSKQNANALIELGYINHPDAKHYLSLYFTKSQEDKFSHLNIEQIPMAGSVNQISQILEPVAKGLGFTVLPKSAVDAFKDLNKLSVFKPKKTVVEVQYLVKKRNRDLPKRFELITSTLKEHFSITSK